MPGGGGGNKSVQFKYEEIVALTSYCLSSLTITLLNKAVLSSSQFGMNFLLLGIQAVTSVLLLGVCRFTGTISFKPLRKSESIQWLPVSLLLIAMIYTGSKTLQYLTVAMFTVFKNITIIIVALGEERIFGSRINGLMWISFGLMVFGSIVGGMNDLSFNAVGYFWMILNSASSAAYLLYMKGTIKSVGFTDYDSVFYNNMLSIPILFFLSLIFEDWTSFTGRIFYENSISSNLKLSFGIVLSGIAGFFISFTTAWCLRVSPSTTYSMVGALNKLPVALSGLIFFPLERQAFNLGYLLSIVIAFCAGLIYSYAQVIKKRVTEVTEVTEEIKETNELNAVEFELKPTIKSSLKPQKLKSTVIEILGEYENRLGIRANYEEIFSPKIQGK